MIKFKYLVILLLAILFLKFFVKIKDKIGNFFHVLDIPKKDKIHKKITPLIGVFPVIILSFILLIYFNIINEAQNVFYIFLYSYLFFIMGYLDDRYTLNAYLKLSISLVITLIAINLIESFSINQIYIESINKTIILNEIKIFFSVLCVLLLINSLNLMDGINGLASGFASGWLLSLSLLSNNENVFILFLILSLFMLVNTFQIIKGKYFLGDSGTLFLGCLVGLCTIYTYNIQLALGNLISVEKIFIFFMIPGIDMFRLFITRLLQKKDPFGGDLNHLHHILVKQFSNNTTLLIYSITFISTNLLSYFNVINTLLIIIIYLNIYILAIFFSKKKFKNTP
jgi:UDP-GlcNAc:undecaprenyl-phosphate/decaprenyl-phosphate GlcNAc-1-phosphate transferase